MSFIGRFKHYHSNKKQADIKFLLLVGLFFYNTAHCSKKIVSANYPYHLNFMKKKDWRTSLFNHSA